MTDMLASIYTDAVHNNADSTTVVCLSWCDGSSVDCEVVVRLRDMLRDDRRRCFFVSVPVLATLVLPLSLPPFPTLPMLKLLPLSFKSRLYT